MGRTANIIIKDVIHVFASIGKIMLILLMGRRNRERCSDIVMLRWIWALITPWPGPHSDLTPQQEYFGILFCNSMEYFIAISAVPPTANWQQAMWYYIVHVLHCSVVYASQQNKYEKGESYI